MHTEPPARVVVVDDDPDLVDALLFLLQSLGRAGLVCRPTVEVQRCIVEADPQLVILDVRMAQLDGIDVFHQLRAHPATRTVPVIFFTATEQRVAQRLPDYQHQNAWFVVNPNIAQLAARIEQLLGPAV